MTSHGLGARPDVERLLVVGAGAMGSQIAMVCALAGIETRVHDLAADALERAEAQLRSRMDRRVAKGQHTAEECDAAFARLRFGTDLAALASDVDYVIEAAVEKLDVKRSLFATLDGLVPPHAILATNSSSFVPSRIAGATERPDRFCNLHFFNPALVMRCVEIVRGPETSDHTFEVTRRLAERIGKQVVVLDKEIPGFVANRILNAIRDEANHLLAEGVASIESIDIACREALGHPMGPYELQDLTGLDIAYYTKTARFEETGDPADAPHPLLAERVERGDLGRKTGRGWYSYAEDGTRLS